MFAPYPVMPPEVNSAGFYDGPGGSSLAATGAALVTKGAAHEAAAAAIMANTGMVQAAWQSFAGAATVPPAIARAVWHGTVGGIHQTNGGILTGLATTFETLKAATPSPGEIAANRATDVALNSSNFLGMLTPQIVANNAAYIDKMWIPAAANMTAWNTTAEAAVSSMPPVPPAPLMTTNPGVSEQPVTETATKTATKTAGGLGQTASSSQMLTGMTSLLPSLAQAPMALMQAPMQVAQLPAQLGSQLMSGPMQLSGMLSSMIQNKGIGVGSGALGGGNPLESAVKASTGGGGAGVGSSGGAALRTPLGLSSTPASGVNAAAVAPPRESKLQAARTTGVGATGGGTVGALPMSAMHRGGHGSEDQSGSSRTATNRLQLAAATHIPVITGSGAVPADNPVQQGQEGSHSAATTSADQVWRHLITKD